MTSIRLSPRPPYDFTKMVRRLQGVKHELYRMEDYALVRTVRLAKASSPLLVRIDSIGTIEKPELKVDVAGGGKLGEAEKLELERLLGRMLSAEVELNPFYEHMEALGDEWSAICARFRGLHLLLEADLFECMCKTVIGQQLNLAFASELNRRLMGAAAQPLEHKGVIYPVFPSPEEVASLEYEQLQTLQFSRRKAEYVIDWARAIVSGTVDLQALFAMDNEEIMERLTRLRGIGRWSVECFLLFGMGRTDLLPAADIGLRNALKKLYGRSEQPKEEEVRRIGASWTPWSSYASLYLWESLHDSERA
ncbi:DNA-3-methyladenine glycosylase family protein [Paenibacillus allorhizosphaerae]|uniref:DNA-3-methyladenine glycosylase II n=1 Tax=Paenibacillus allorhizosphaerae TaxID=2849866 RepID=A0ABN7TRL2_9BACL|nr:DNA-3-methyladenine glycosylase [Paenibacillus allorhizosphaerae]CAG7648293.1 DNA-3-methyladenine glycosylase [Paenibacillus allorhizosphaerae]